MNHFPSCCQKVKSAHDLIVQTLYVNTVSSDGDDKWVVPADFGGNIVPMRIDSGAQANIISKEDFQRIRRSVGNPKLHAPNVRLKSISQDSIKVVGKAVLPVTLKSDTRAVFYVCENIAENLLSKELCLKQGYITLNVDAVKQESEAVKPEPKSSDDPKYQKLKAEYQDVFQGLGCIPGKHHIVVDENVPPVVHPCRKIPFQLHDKVKAELDRMEDMGVVTKIDEPTPWVNSLVVVPKKNGDIRICMDPRDLNRAIQRQHYKLPTREEVMAKFADAKYFSKLDEIGRAHV